jgi:hypothetical protein
MTSFALIPLDLHLDVKVPHETMTEAFQKEVTNGQKIVRE